MAMLKVYLCHSLHPCCRKGLLPNHPIAPGRRQKAPPPRLASPRAAASSEYPSFFRANEDDSLLWPSFHWCSPPSSSHQLWRYVPTCHRKLDGAEEAGSSLVAKELQDSLLALEILPPPPPISVAEKLAGATTSSSSSLVAMPFSLRMLQLKQSYVRGRRRRRRDSSSSSSSGTEELEPLQSALSSLLSMMETLQARSISDNLCNWVHKETHQSFLWLFHQVFSRTPHLMLTVMLLLVDFATFSVTKTPSSLVPPPPPPSTPLSMPLNPSETLLYRREYTPPFPSSSCPFEQTPNWNSSFSFSNKPAATRQSPPNEGVINRGFEHRPRLLEADMDMATPPLRPPVTDSVDNALGSDMEPVVPSMVAPLSVRLEPDNYLCYDRTELDYQYAISSDSANPLLLSNYAYFLYTVRHDHRRAIEFYRRALRADPSDGEVNGRFATFLWLGCGDIAAADKAYQASISADPNNPFYIGSYTHFLWHAGDKGKSCPITPTT